MAGPAHALQSLCAARCCSCGCLMQITHMIPYRHATMHINLSSSAQLLLVVLVHSIANRLLASSGPTLKTDPIRGTRPSTTPMQQCHTLQHELHKDESHLYALIYVLYAIRLAVAHNTCYSCLAQQGCALLCNMHVLLPLPT
jgi:hypothetical protein